MSNKENSISDTISPVLRVQNSLHPSWKNIPASTAYAIWFCALVWSPPQPAFLNINIEKSCAPRKITWTVVQLLFSPRDSMHMNPKQLKAQFTYVLGTCFWFSPILYPSRWRILQGHKYCSTDYLPSSPLSSFTLVSNRSSNAPPLFGLYHLHKEVILNTLQQFSGLLSVPCTRFPVDVGMVEVT